MPGNVQWQTILATALVTSFFTACLTEPVKALLQRYVERRRIRHLLYREISRNFQALYTLVSMLPESDRTTGFGVRFSMAYKRLAYDLALKDAHVLYSLGPELSWIEALYGDFEYVIQGRFDDEIKRFYSAESTCYLLLNNLKHRRMSQSLMFKVAEPWAITHFRERLPKIAISQ